MLGAQMQFELSRLVDAAWAVAAYAAQGRDDLSPQQRAAVERALTLSGLPVGSHDPEFAAALTSQLAQAAAFAEGPTKGWGDMPDEVLLAQGRGSRQVADWIVDEAAPVLGLTGIAERTDTAFLDVGVGTGQLAARIAERWPRARVVGVDRMERVLGLARTVIDKAGCADRVELRHGDVTDLADDAVYDLAWLPLSFMSPDAIPKALEAVRRVLRPGGWVIATTFAADFELPIVNAMSDLVTAVNGGSSLTQEDLLVEIRAAGYSESLALPSTPLTGALTAARG
ncbi:class I SAM-dependent methyltransferase [Streptomyces murinus]|uniref:class I SAM-dependent methyltransferase n=1 Tax=Streptomyces murinus TaxID=33900 RepID=UPI0018F49254|nr:class I SAM-dependent methyltransferase [Streptomyces murinus]